MWCQTCQREFPSSYTFCPNCGAPTTSSGDSLSRQSVSSRHTHSFPQLRKGQAKSRTILLVALVVLVLLMIGSFITLSTVILHKSYAPGSREINPGAALTITSATSTNLIDKSNFEPIGQTRSFKVGNTVYIAVTFVGRMGYSMVRLYRNDELDVNSKILTVHTNDTNGAFSFQIDSPGQFVAAVYWCKDWNCDNPALARLVDFSAS